jgi:hypothetical protein
MGSNNLIAVDATGARIPGNPIQTGQGPCGLAVDEARGQLYVYNRFEGSLSVISLSTEKEISRVPFFDPTPAAIKAGRPLLYDTHRTSGLGQVSCASCHADARTDRLAWDLGDPSGGIKAVSGAVHNLGAGIPGLTGGFTNFRPMKGPMTTQTMQDIIGKEPLHWRGDRNGIEEFNGAFMSLLGDDVMLTPAEMAQFKAFLSSIYFPPNPYRNPDNTLPQNLPLPGHYTSGRFSPAGQPLPNGNAKRALDTLYRPVSRRIDGGAFACVTCHNVPIGIGTNTTLSVTSFLPIPLGPNGEKHHALVSIDGSTQKSLKVPQLRNMCYKVGFEMTQPVSRAGFGFAHDGAIDSLSRFVSEGAFTTANDQEVADLVALMLSFSGSEFGSPVDGAEPPGTSSQDTHAAVGRQAFLTGPAQPAAEAALLNQLVTLASAGKIDLVAHAAVNGAARGWFLTATGWQSDEKTVVETLPAMLARATAAGPVCFTAVVKGTGRRLGIDRDRDGLLDYDETRDLAPNVPGIQNPFRPDAFDALGNAGASGADGTADGQNDFDGDGVSNEAEFAAGTNPAQQLAVDVPMALKLASSGTPFTVSLTWHTAPCGQCEISWSADLMQWTPLATGLVDALAGGGAYTWTDTGLPATPSAPSAAGKRYYRVNRLK